MLIDYPVSLTPCPEPDNQLNLKKLVKMKSQNTTNRKIQSVDRAELSDSATEIDEHGGPTIRPKSLLKSSSCPIAKELDLELKIKPQVHVSDMYSSD